MLIEQIFASGYQEQKPRAPAAAMLRPFSSATGGDLAWDGWAVDVRLELANLVFPTGLTDDASVVRLLETDTNSVCCSRETERDCVTRLGFSQE